VIEINKIVTSIIPTLPIPIPMLSASIMTITPRVGCACHTPN